MEAKAHLKDLRITPRKVKIVLDLVRNKPLGTAIAILKNTPKAASEPIRKLVESCAANAENNFNMDPSKLYLKECWVGPAKMMKRMMPRGRGSSDRILKRASHISVVLAEKD